jgi:hypothetical protein
MWFCKVPFCISKTRSCFKEYHEWEERASQGIVQKERLQWESLEKVEDGDLLLALAISASADEYSSPVSHTSSQSMSEAEMAALQRADVLERALRESSRKIKRLEQQLEQALSPVSGTFIRIDQHKRRKGTKLTGEERHAVLHCYEVCREEKHRGSVVPTLDPFLRTAVYFGTSQNTVRDAVHGKNLEDRRGVYSRFSWMRLIASDLRQRAAALNISGSVVALKRLHDKKVPTDE